MKKLSVFFISLVVSLSAQAAVVKADVCVYGESAAGVMAAIQAARLGKNTVLVSKNNHVGGMATSGLTATDINRQDQVGGLAAEFYGRIWDYYIQPEVWRNQTREEFMLSSRKRTFTGKNDARQIQWVYESGVAEQIMKDMLSEAGVKVIYNAPLDLKNGASVRKGVITRINLLDGTQVKAKMFIDCSYEGDLMASAGVSYIIGREGVDQYGEDMAGIRKFKFIPTSPYLNGKDGELIPYVAPQMYGEVGSADGRTQAYCYRVTLTDDPENMIPISKPENYNPALYEIVIRRFQMEEGLQLKDIITFTPMPNRKTDTNHLDFFGASFDYVAGDYEVRARMEQEHKDYAVGMLWCLGHDERVPEPVRAEMLRWGWPKDEFVENGGFPYQIYVREARRMIGEKVMTQHHVHKAERLPVEHSVGIGTYMMDCHFVSYVAGDGGVIVEGGIFTSTKPYAIDYYSLTPKRQECTNLLVPVCLSASHVAYTTIRMEPTYMILGQSAAVAVVQAIDSKRPVQDIDYPTLRNTLEQLGQFLTPSNKKVQHTTKVNR
ncbi:MAG: FAD-dependent oxidoreductase [Bacteroidales bacterium]|nr:FAD-dependent oxidoreductase [Bacteroidales bacterium]